jgi:ribonuclease P protein component
MLAKNNRIRLDKDFDRAFKTGQSLYNKYLGVKVVDNKLTEVRFGFLIGLKVSKKAVLRNKLRRQIRSIIEQELPLLKSGKDIIIVTFSLILDKNFEEIKFILKESLNKLKLYK